MSLRLFLCAAAAKFPQTFAVHGMSKSTILQALALLINSYWSIPCIDYILVEVIPCVRLGGVLLFLWGALGWLFNRREKEDGQ